MIPDEQAPPPAGHNQPPSPIEYLVAEQREACEQFKPRIDEIIAAMKAKDVDDMVRAGDAADLLKIGEKVRKRVDADRRERTGPYREAADAAKAEADKLLDPLIAASEALGKRLDLWVEMQSEAAQAQRTEQADALGDAAKGPEDVSANPLPKREPRKIIATGDLGAKVTTAPVEEFEITDISVIPDYVMSSPTVHAAIIQVVKSMAKHVPHIPGVKRTTSTTNRIR